jgi:hypothetical protein
MILNIRDTALLRLKALNKQVLEARLAKQVYEVFDRGAALQKLQAMAGLIMQALGRGDAGAFDRAVKAECALRLWERVPKTQSVFAVYSGSRMYLSKLDASDCADLIRLAGEWVEQGGMAAAGFTGFTSTDWQKDRTMSDSIKEAYRSGVGSGSNKSQVENVWADRKGRFSGVGASNRERGDGRNIEDHVRGWMRDPNAFSGMAGKPGTNNKFSKRVKGTSNVLRIDRVFGLLEACDISGTTTDTVFALEVFGAEAGLTAGYYLLPLGTIVHNMHHSLLEVATALTLTKCIDYHIGFFSTLAPLAHGGLPSELRALSGIFSGAEAEMRANELHFLNYYAGGQLRGAYLITGNDIDRFKTSNLSHSTTMLDKARCLLSSDHPPVHEIVRLMEHCMPGAKIPSGELAGVAV